MSKMSIFLLLIMLLTLNSIAQTPFEELEEISSEISSMQIKTEGLIYSDKAGTHELSFPEDNFKVLVSSRLAYHAVYRKTNNQEVLYYTEGIDLSTALYSEIEYLSDEIGVVKLWFTSGYLQTDHYLDGDIINRTSGNYLPFYFKINKSDVYWEMVLVNEICNKLKIEKGLISQEKSTSMYEDFRWLTYNFTSDKISLFEKFKYNYPYSVYSKVVEIAISKFKKEIEIIRARKEEEERLANEQKEREEVALKKKNERRSWLMAGASVAIAGGLMTGLLILVNQ